jgi:cell division protein FtsQ
MPLSADDRPITSGAAAPRPIAAEPTALRLRADAAIRPRLPAAARRRRWRIRLPHHFARRTAITLALMALVGGAAATLRTQGTIGPITLVTEFGLQVSRMFGLTVQDILVEGRQRADRDLVMAAIGIDRGASLLRFDAAAARLRLEELPWIDTAIVERRLPDVIYVKLTEHKPLALWQNEGKFALIDPKGAVILPEATSQFAKLPVVIGKEAPKHAESLLLLLATEPALAARVSAAIRLGDRRWNLIMNNGVEIRLPEEEAELAWARVAAADRDRKLLARDVQMIDLRMPDRMIIRTGSPPAERLRQQPRPS